MKISGNLITFLLILLFQVPLEAQNAELFFRAAGSPSNPKVQVSWNKYYTYEGITDICRKLVKEYPGLVKMESAGKSYQGRDIIALTITDKKSGDPGHRPVTTSTATYIRTRSREPKWRCILPGISVRCREKTNSLGSSSGTRPSTYEPQ